MRVASTTSSTELGTNAQINIPVEISQIYKYMTVKSNSSSYKKTVTVNGTTIINTKEDAQVKYDLSITEGEGSVPTGTDESVIIVKCTMGSTGKYSGMPFYVILSNS